MTKIEWDNRVRRLSAGGDIPASLYRHPHWFDDATQEQLLQTLEAKYPREVAYPSMQGIERTPQLTPIACLLYTSDAADE